MFFVKLKDDNLLKSNYFKNVDEYILLSNIHNDDKYINKEDIYNINNKLTKGSKIDGLEVIFDNNINKYKIISGNAIYINALKSNWQHIWIKKYEICDITKKNKEINKLLRKNNNTIIKKINIFK